MLYGRAAVAQHACSSCATLTETPRHTGGNMTNNKQNIPKPLPMRKTIALICLLMGIGMTLAEAQIRGNNITVTVTPDH